MSVAEQQAEEQRRLQRENEELRLAIARAEEEKARAEADKAIAEGDKAKALAELEALKAAKPWRPHNATESIASAAKTEQINTVSQVANKQDGNSKKSETDALSTKPVNHFFSAPHAAQSKMPENDPDQIIASNSQTEAAPKSSLDVALSAAMKEYALTYALTPPKSTKNALHKWGLLGLVVGIAGWLGGSIASFALVQNMTSNSGSLFSSAYDGSLTTLATFATNARASFFIGIVGFVLLIVSFLVVDDKARSKPI
jgi:hypothetical protein